MSAPHSYYPYLPYVSSGPNTYSAIPGYSDPSFSPGTPSSQSSNHPMNLFSSTISPAAQVDQFTNPYIAPSSFFTPSFVVSCEKGLTREEESAKQVEIFEKEQQRSKEEIQRLNRQIDDLQNKIKSIPTIEFLEELQRKHEMQLRNQEDSFEIERKILYEQIRFLNNQIETLYRQIPSFRTEQNTLAIQNQAQSYLPGIPPQNVDPTCSLLIPRRQNVQEAQRLSQIVQNSAQSIGYSTQYVCIEHQEIINQIRNIRYKQARIKTLEEELVFLLDKYSLWKKLSIKPPICCLHNEEIYNRARQILTLVHLPKSANAPDSSYDNNLLSSNFLNFTIKEQDAILIEQLQFLANPIAFQNNPTYIQSIHQDNQTILNVQGEKIKAMEELVTAIKTRCNS